MLNDRVKVTSDDDGRVLTKQLKRSPYDFTNNFNISEHST